MSLFGNNIRKIRSVKSLSQQSFAEIFDLKRGTLGAYEEGRSEPKIDTIIRISNYFSIPIGDILTKELTVNQLTSFKGDPDTTNLTGKEDTFSKIPCIDPENYEDYIQYCDKQNYIQDLPSIQIPVNNEKDLRAFIINDLEMSKNSDGLYPEDVVIAEKVLNDGFSNIKSSILYLTVTNENILVRRLFPKGESLILKADREGVQDIEIDISEIKEMWEVKYVFYHRLPKNKSSEIDKKLFFLEKEIQKLRTSLE
ncbi:helix-turn-helix domain-containing protein [Gramella lutea]|uniref:Helix-turn-helix domain-containing protein n=1 Tax=Christiangramia lutea TaxID=1607951 RepID=A0A9X1V6Y6_9FLAO|nr:helix-turn-helix transcriptional regulator [Christiangramia lutea]MCH4824144.1 helix-turn-helix domain-containing protein [Christiangramia lutea]